MARRLLLFLSAACLVPAVLDSLQAYLQGLVAGESTPWRQVLWQGSEWLIFGALTPIAFYVGRRFPLRRPLRLRNLLPHLLAALAVCVGWATAGAALRWMLGLDDGTVQRSRQLASWLLTSLPWSVFMYFAVLGSIHAVFYFVEARQREAAEHRLAARLAEAQLGALRMQLNPHFVFNSLNAITVLVRDGEIVPATRMLELLGDVLRGVLRRDAAHEVPLAQELDFLERYLAIEQVRFSDRLRVRWEVDPALRAALVPPLILQPLVENALRHGLARLASAGLVEIGARREGEVLVLTVRDDGPGPGAAASDAAPGGASRSGHGVGLDNGRERLQALHGDRASLEIAAAVPRGTLVTVRLPLRFADGGEPDDPDARPAE